MSNERSEKAQDVAPGVNGHAFKCHLPGHENEILKAEEAEVFSLQLIGAKVKRRATVEDLAEFTFCRTAAGFARDKGMRMYLYLKTVEQIRQRDAEREAASGYFGQFAGLQDSRREGRDDRGQDNRHDRRNRR